MLVRGSRKEPVSKAPESTPRMAWTDACGKPLPCCVISQPCDVEPYQRLQDRPFILAFCNIHASHLAGFDDVRIDLAVYAHLWAPTSPCASRAPCVHYALIPLGCSINGFLFVSNAGLLPSLQS